jgi:hypothetical protein
VRHLKHVGHNLATCTTNPTHVVSPRRCHPDVASSSKGATRGRRPLSSTHGGGARSGLPSRTGAVADPRYREKWHGTHPHTCRSRDGAWSSSAFRRRNMVGAGCWSGVPVPPESRSATESRSPSSARRGRRLPLLSPHEGATARSRCGRRRRNSPRR